MWGACGKAFRLKTVRLLGKTERSRAEALRRRGKNDKLGMNCLILQDNLYTLHAESQIAAIIHYLHRTTMSYLMKIAALNTLTGLLKRLRQQRNLKIERKNLQMLLTLNEEKYFKYPRIKELSSDKKKEIKNNLAALINEISFSQNPFITLRQKIASITIEFADYQVLCLTESEKTAAFYSDCDFISGDLYKYIDRCIEYRNELKEIKWKYPNTSNDELISFCNSFCLIYLYYIDGLNAVRVSTGDVDNVKDWYKPFLKSMLIWSEDSIRSKIGLPSLCKDGLEVIKYSTFMNLVLDGHKNPYFEWDNIYKIKT